VAAEDVDYNPVREMARQLDLDVEQEVRKD
jgi:hypothetical protein